MNRENHPASNTGGAGSGVNAARRSWRAGFSPLHAAKVHGSDARAKAGGGFP